MNTVESGKVAAVTDPVDTKDKFNPTIPEAGMFVKPFPSPSNDPEKEPDPIPSNDPDVLLVPTNDPEKILADTKPCVSTVSRSILALDIVKGVPVAETLADT